jgi:hypothetical protein
MLFYLVCLFFLVYAPISVLARPTPEPGIRFFLAFSFTAAIILLIVGVLNVKRKRGNWHSQWFAGGNSHFTTEALSARGAVIVGKIRIWLGSFAILLHLIAFGVLLARDPGRFTIEAENVPPGLQVTLDGVPEPLPIKVPNRPEQHTLVFSAPGFMPFKVLVAPDGKRKRVSVPLEMQPLPASKRTVYLVQGHGERGFTTSREGDANASLSHLKELLGTQNWDARDLSIAQGLGNEVPADAALVMVIGPEQAMLAEETAALLRYFRGGGRLLIAVDPDRAATAAPLLEGLSIELSPVRLANDRVFWARTHQKADRTAIVATSYSSHPALATLSQSGAPLPVVFVGAGTLGKTKVAPSPAPTVDLVVRTDGSTWEDKNGNFEFDKDDEHRKAYNVAAAVTLRPALPAAGKPAAKPEPESRAFVVGDADAFSDLTIVNHANAVFAVYVLRWLLGEPGFGGAR